MSKLANIKLRGRFFVLVLAVVAVVGLTAACGGQPGAGAPSAAGQEAAATASGAPSATSQEAAATAAGAPTVTLVSQAQLLERIDAAEVPMVLDVRTPEEFAAGHVPGAINVPHTELAARLAEVEAARERGVVVYCESGRRAGMAEEILLGAGFPHVMHLEGDMRAWREAELPTERPGQ